MGKFDSSVSRVAPVFNRLIEKGKVNKNWLKTLLELPVTDEGRTMSSTLNFKVTSSAWYPNEKSLDPPLSLLAWLLENLHKHPPNSAYLGSRLETAKKRIRILAGDSSLIEQGKKSLVKQPIRKQWYVFESHSRPDVYIETKKIIVVIEGKRLERAPTTRTTWMHVRHQMLRHIDAAYEIADGKKVFGFFIVEGGFKGAVPEKWRLFSENTISDEVLEKSLPHRSWMEIASIRESFLGVTTWQKVCKKFDIDWNEIKRAKN